MLYLTAADIVVIVDLEAQTKTNVLHTNTIN